MRGGKRWKEDRKGEYKKEKKRKFREGEKDKGRKGEGGKEVIRQVVDHMIR